MRIKFLRLSIFVMLSSAFSFAQTSVTLTGSETKSSLESQYKELKDKIKIDERNIQRMEEQKKDSEAQVEIDRATLRKYKAQLEEDKTRIDRLKEQLNLEEGE